MTDEVIKVYVGADRSQQLAIDVLAYSIRRHTTAKVDVIPMVDLDVPTPENPRNMQRTGFSFSRFCIPKLASYTGKAIYMDADMQVFKDIRELWEYPFNGKKVLIQETVKHTDITQRKDNAPAKRIKQCAVMLLDCQNLDWDIESIISRMDDGELNYESLMYHLELLDEDEIGYSIPFEWNSLEYFDQSTRLIHYTDMGTQPWVSTYNANGDIWFSEVRSMLKEGLIDLDAIRSEIKLGYFRPSLILDIKYRHLIPNIFRPLLNQLNQLYDKLKQYQPHKEVYTLKRARKKAIKVYDQMQKEKNK